MTNDAGLVDLDSVDLVDVRALEPSAPEAIDVDVVGFLQSTHALVDVDAQEMTSVVEVLGDASGVEVTKVVPSCVAAAEDGAVWQRCSLSAVEVDSGGSSSSSSSSSSARNHKRRRLGAAVGRLGAAAGTAIVTAVAPLDVDEADRIENRSLELPLDFAMQLQHEGGLVAMMVETGTVIGISPLHAEGGSSASCSMRVSGHCGGVARAVWQLEQLLARDQEEARLAADTESTSNMIMEQLEVPIAHMNAIVGSLSSIRRTCGGILIALQPGARPDSPALAFVGPGRREHVVLATTELKRRLHTAENRLSSAVPESPASRCVPGPAGRRHGSAMDDLENELRAVEAEVRASKVAELTTPELEHLPMPSGPPCSFGPPRFDSV